MSNVDPASLVDLIETAAKAAVQRSLLETVVPIIRHGTVIAIDINKFIHDVQMDGDSSTIQVHDILQFSSYVGARVTVMFAPPHQAMIIGQPIHDEWHRVGASNEIPFNTGWGNDPGAGNLDTATFPFTMFKRVGNWVELRGYALRTSGSSNTILTMPVGYRPRNNLTFVGLNGLTGHEGLWLEQDGELIHPAGGNGPIIFQLSYSVN